MVVVGRLVGTFEPARVMVAIAQARSASARANTIAPTQPAGATAGTNGKGVSRLSASPASTETAHAIGGRIITFALSVVLAMAGLGHCKHSFERIRGCRGHCQQDDGPACDCFPATRKVLDDPQRS